MVSQSLSLTGLPSYSPERSVTPRWCRHGGYDMMSTQWEGRERIGDSEQEAGAEGYEQAWTTVPLCAMQG